MSDYFEIDFLGVETKSSGDAIAMRYSIQGVRGVHVIDGGYLDTGDQIVSHLKTYYGTTHVDHMVLTHPDRDHANGLRAVLSECTVGTLWMNRPWVYAEHLLPYFKNYTSAKALRDELRSVYASAVELETLALDSGIEIAEPFQGRRIGPFHVMAPTIDRWLQCVVDSPKTPEPIEENQAKGAFAAMWTAALDAAKSLVAAAWGDEYFPPAPTSPDNEMSVVQYAKICEREILLTGDTGREGLQETIDFAPAVGLTLPGIDIFQVPHHGGRHNVSTEVLDKLLGQRLPAMPEKTIFNAVCSSAKADPDHPRKSVVRAMLHRGAHFSQTEGTTVRFSRNITREGWSPLPQVSYPQEQES